jgi:hypothetical protein
VTEATGASEIYLSSAELCGCLKLCDVSNPHNLVRHEIMHHVPGLRHERDGGVRHGFLQPDGLLAVHDLVVASDAGNAWSFPILLRLGSFRLLIDDAFGDLR